MSIFSITAGSSITAISFNLPPHAHRSTSISNTRLSNRAHVMRTGALYPCSQSPSPVVVCCTDTGTTFDLNFAFGASTSWNRIRCSRGRGTKAASRCMNSIGVSTMWVVPYWYHGHAVFSLRLTLPSRLTARRSLEIAGRVM